MTRYSIVQGGNLNGSGSRMTDACLQVKEVPKHLHAIADGFIIVYSIDDEHSFQIADVIRKDIERNREKKELVIIVMGNKLDLANRRRVDTVQALNWAAKEKVKLFEVSSLNRDSLVEPFVYLSSKLNPPPNKSTFSQLTGRNKWRTNL